MSFHRVENSHIIILELDYRKLEKQRKRKSSKALVVWG